MPSDCCAGQQNGIMYCFDGAVQVFPFPTGTVDVVLVCTPGGSPGLAWVNKASLGTDVGKAAPPKPPPAPAPSTKKPPPHRKK